MATAGKILMYPVGSWTSGNNYGFLDIVYFGGSSHIAKTDIANSTINPDTDTANWQILAHGYMADTLSGIDGTDTSGLLGTAGAIVSSQALMDKVADMVADKLVLKTAISNQQINDPTRITGSALSHAMDQDITNLELSLDATNTNVTNITNLLVSPLVYKGKLTGDLNRTTISPGYYGIDSSATVSNAPSGTEYTGFIQFPNTLYNLQMILGGTGGVGVKTRRYVGSPASWSAWS